MDTPAEKDDFERLHDLVAGMDDIKEFIEGMTALAAANLSVTSGATVECAVTLHRRKRSATIAGSSEAAKLVDDREQNLGDGPCLESLRTGVPVLLESGSRDTRWPAFEQEMTTQGFASVLGVPLSLGDNASAALDFFSTEPDVFTGETAKDAERFSDVAGRALRLGLRIAAAELHAQDLTAAMDSRTAIDMACGIIMAQNRCSPREAFDMLRDASSTRNEKLHAVARGVVSRISTTPETAAHFQP